MNHGLTNDVLCAACKVEARFADNSGKQKAIAGTGFFVQNSKHEICFLTNRHVVDLDYKQPTPDYKDFKLNQVVVHVKAKDKTTGLPTEDYHFFVLNYADFIFSKNKENDVACLKNIKVIEIKGRNPIVIDFFVPHTWLADNKWLEEKLLVCDFVAFPGFPDWYDRRNNLPILRTGTIASDPRFNYSYSGEDEGDAIAYEAFSYGGSSGSPVFAIEKGIRVSGSLSGGGHREVKLIGINAGHLKNQDVVKSHSGISYFYKSSVILELIDK